MRAWRGFRRRRRQDDGAAAVEFALVSPLLFLIVFGVLQYGYGLFELQSAQSTVTSAAREAAAGLNTCAGSATAPGLREITQKAARANGFRPFDGTGSGTRQPFKVQMAVTTAVATNPMVSTNDLLTVTIKYSPRIDLFFVPFPSSITRSAGASIDSVGNSNLKTCSLTGVPL